MSIELRKYVDYLITEADGKPPATKGEKKVKQPDQPMVFSQKFRDILTAIQNMKQSNVSKRLLEMEQDKTKFFDISYVDISDDGENVTFLQSARIERLKKEDKPEEDYWTSKMRTPMKVGRFIKQVYPKFSDDAIQKFSNKFKTIVKEADEAINFEIVEGEDIVFWYDGRNYENEDGTLGGSCMQGEDCGPFFNCYKDNPNQCKMLILKNKDGDKIKGRAIVWKLSKPKDTIFMDRVYTNSDEDEMLFTNYAKREGWLYKDEQKYGGTFIMVPGKGSQDTELEVILENTNYDRYPYLDTLRYFYPESKMMASHPDGDGKRITLTDTDGYYEEFRGEGYVDPIVYDAYNNEEIPESRATWCRYDNAYCASEDAIRLSYNNEFAFPKSPHIVYSEYTKKWYAKEDCVYSKPLVTWLWKKYAVQVYHDKNKRQKFDWYHRFELNKTIGKVGDDYYDIDLLYEKEKKKSPGKIVGKTKTEVSYGFKEDVM